MKKRLFLLILLAAGLIFLPACGGKTDESSEMTTPVEGKVPETAGVVLAQRILEVFDECVAKVVELAAAKPEPEDLTPQLEALYDKYQVKMAELNQEYLALREQDISQFGAANSYLGEHRGRHVFQKDSLLGEAVAYYNFQKGDQELVKLLSNRPVELLERALQR